MSTEALDSAMNIVVLIGGAAVVAILWVVVVALSCSIYDNYFK